MAIVYNFFRDELIRPQGCFPTSICFFYVLIHFQSSFESFCSWLHSSGTGGHDLCSHHSKPSYSLRSLHVPFLYQMWPSNSWLPYPQSYSKSSDCKKRLSSVSEYSERRIYQRRLLQ